MENELLKRVAALNIAAYLDYLKDVAKAYDKAKRTQRALKNYWALKDKKNQDGDAIIQEEHEATGDWHSITRYIFTNDEIPIFRVFTIEEIERADRLRSPNVRGLEAEILARSRFSPRQMVIDDLRQEYYERLQHPYFQIYLLNIRKADPVKITSESWKNAGELLRGFLWTVDGIKHLMRSEDEPVLILPDYRIKFNGPTTLLLKMWEPFTQVTSKKPEYKGKRMLKASTADITALANQAFVCLDARPQKPNTEPVKLAWQTYDNQLFYYLAKINKRIYNKEGKPIIDATAKELGEMLALHFTPEKSAETYRVGITSGTGEKQPKCESLPPLDAILKGFEEVARKS